MFLLGQEVPRHHTHEKAYQTLERFWFAEIAAQCVSDLEGEEDPEVLRYCYLATMRDVVRVDDAIALAPMGFVTTDEELESLHEYRLRYRLRMKMIEEKFNQVSPPELRYQATESDWESPPQAETEAESDEDF